MAIPSKNNNNKYVKKREYLVPLPEWTLIKAQTSHKWLKGWFLGKVTRNLSDVTYNNTLMLAIRVAI